MCAWGGGAGGGRARVWRVPGHVVRRWAAGSGLCRPGAGAGGWPLHCFGEKCGWGGGRVAVAAGPGGDASSRPSGQIGPGVLQPLSEGNRVRGGEWLGLGVWGGAAPPAGVWRGGGGSRSLEEVVGHLNAQSTCFHRAHGGCRCRRHRGWVRTGKSALFLSLARPTPERRREGIPAAPGAWRGGSLRGGSEFATGGGGSSGCQ